MNILLIFSGFIVAFIILFYYENKIREPKNNVHFYVARDKSGCLYLHIGKPFRDDHEFSNNLKMYYRLRGDSFKHFGLNENDYDNLTWDDEPVEVFVNMKD